MSMRILEHLGYPSARVLSEPGEAVGPETRAQINEIVSEIHRGRPLQYVLGSCIFDELHLLVDERVLIPRPETEEMLYQMVDFVKKPPQRIVDLGTGSGCLALALKKRFPFAEVWGIDLSDGALNLARENAGRNDLAVQWKRADILHAKAIEQLPDDIDLLVSNPPYVCESEKKRMERKVLEYEPALALFVEDHDPLRYYRAIARMAKRKLKPGGMVWVEINERFGKETASLFDDKSFSHSGLLKDIHEKDRFVYAKRCRP